MSREDMAQAIGEMVKRKLSPLLDNISHLARGLVELEGKLDSLKGDIAPIAKRVDDIEAKSESAVSVRQNAFETGQEIARQFADVVLKTQPAEAGKTLTTVDDVKEIVGELVAEAVAAIPKPKDGDPGLKGDPGKDAEPIEISAVAAEVLAGDEMATLVSLHVAEAVDKFFAANPPKQGDRGLQGDPGKAADPVNVADVVSELLRSAELKAMTERHASEIVTRYFEANPVRHGKDGTPGLKGDPGESIKGDPGEPGVGLAGAIIDREGELVITTTKGEAIKLGKVVGRDGEKGKDGGDFTDATIDYDGERGLVIRSKGGAEIVRRLPIPIDRGYWREGMSAEKADLLTHSGSVWIALKDTSAKPCLENAEDWRLFVRKGRDGTDGRNGRDLGPQPPVQLSKPSA